MALARAVQHLVHLLCVFCFFVVIIFSATATAATAAAEATITDAGGQDYTSSPKRGLIVIPEQNPHIFTSYPNNSLTWYYNYSPDPSPSIPADSLAFVPQLWGDPSSDTHSETDFLSTVRALLSGAKYNVPAVLAFNEPDGCNSGGSCVSPSRAASLWQTHIAPLKTSHPSLLLGSPATTGSQQGIEWLEKWFTACAGECKPDFPAAHFYGDFQGLASWLGQLHATYPNISKEENGGIWLTEFNLPSDEGTVSSQALKTEQAWFNQTIGWLDSLGWVGKYAMFGAFKSSISNVGPEGTFLDGKGRLTDIGSWYLGGPATGVKPTVGAAERVRPKGALVALVMGMSVVVALVW